MNANRWARSRRAALALIVVALRAGAGHAEAAAGIASQAWDDGSRWIPSFSFFSMGSVDQRQARMSADTSVKQGQGPLDTNGQSFGYPWTAGGTIDISSPVILEVTGRPRFFAHADVGYSYDVDDPVAAIGDPGAPPVLPPQQTSSAAIQNVGASVRAEAKPLTFSGGVGTVFAFRALERGFRFRPTLEWTYGRDTMKTVLGGGESEAPPPSQQCNPSCRFTFIKSQTEKGFHSLGPGFELEADVGRAGQFMIGWYGSFRAYYLVGDRKANLRSRGSWQRFDNQPTTRPDTEFVTRYEREPWHYRFGMGIRVYWLPEE